METVGMFVGTLLQFAVLGAVVWAVVRLLGGGTRADARVDRATTVRRFFHYGLLLLTLLLAAIGLVVTGQEALADHGGDEDWSALAFGLALVLVAVPAHAVLLRLAWRRLATSAEERRSAAWMAYLNAGLLVSLVLATVMVQDLLRGLLGLESFQASSVVPAVVWGGAWLMLWAWPRRVHGLPGDAHLAAGSLTGLVALAVGIGGIVAFAIDAVYRAVVDEVPVGHQEPGLGRWLVALGVGGGVWAWHWLVLYRAAARTLLWNVFVVVAGVLAGTVAVVGSFVALGYWTSVWFWGDPGDASAVEHFEHLPSVAGAVLVTGALSWAYHRSVLAVGGPVVRDDVWRAHDHVLAAAHLVAVVVAATLGVVALIESVTPAPIGEDAGVANRLLFASTLAVVGVPAWWVSWSRIQRHASAEGDDGVEERSSPVRRIHLISVIGIGGLVVLGSLVGVLAGTLEDLLDGRLGSETLWSARIGIALVLALVGAVAYHLAVFRDDRRVLAALAPPVPPPPHPRHVVLVAPRGVEVAGELAGLRAVEVERWYRPGEAPPGDLDLRELAGRIVASESDDVLVVVDASGATVVPLER